MRALRPGWGFRAGRRSRGFAGGGPRGDGAERPGAVFERWRWPGRAPRRWRPPCSSCAMRALRSGRMFRAGRRSRRLAGGGPRGDGAGQPGAVFERWRWPGRAPRRWRRSTSSRAMRALRLGWRSARGGGRAGSRAAARAATAWENRWRVFERRRWPGRAPRRWRRPTSSCAMRALRLGCGSARGGGRDGSRAAARAATAWDNRWRCSSAAGDLVGGRDGGGRRARAAQCAHCALAGCSARGGGRDGSRATARAATAWEDRWRCSSAGGGQAGRRDGGGGRRRAAQCVHCALAGCSARGGGRDGSRAAARAATAWENQRRHSGAGGDPVGRRDGGGRRAQAAQCAHCALAG